uniref:C2H2-type domain-containing protein n=1 Tax=Anopheles atroparvus TaxID=41427 RepID=A0A182JEZ1_ANOAO
MKQTRLFGTKEELKKHRKDNNPHKYVCDVCGARLKHRPSFDAHMERHVGITHFQCSYCSSTFVTLSEVSAHLAAVHLTEDREKCQVCGALFTTKKHLNQHLQSHSTERNHQCSECAASFKSQHHLHRHVKTVHHVVRYNCEHCHMTYGRRDKLRLHLERVHLDLLVLYGVRQPTSAPDARRRHHHAVIVQRQCLGGAHLAHRWRHVSGCFYALTRIAQPLDAALGPKHLLEHFERSLPLERTVVEQGRVAHGVLSGAPRRVHCICRLGDHDAELLVGHQIVPVLGASVDFIKHGERLTSEVGFGEHFGVLSATATGAATIRSHPIPAGKATGDGTRFVQQKVAFVLAEREIKICRAFHGTLQMQMLLVVLVIHNDLFLRWLLQLRLLWATVARFDHHHQVRAIVSIVTEVLLHVVRVPLLHTHGREASLRIVIPAVLARIAHDLRHEPRSEVQRKRGSGLVARNQHLHLLEARVRPDELLVGGTILRHRHALGEEIFAPVRQLPQHQRQRVHVDLLEGGLAVAQVDGPLENLRRHVAHRTDLVDAFRFRQRDLAAVLVPGTERFQREAQIPDTAGEIRLHENVARIEIPVADARFHQVTLADLGVQVRQSVRNRLAHTAEGTERDAIVGQPVLQAPKRGQR